MFWLHDKMTKLRPPADETIARAQQKRPEPEKAENIIKELYSIYKKICPFFIQKFLHFLTVLMPMKNTLKRPAALAVWSVFFSSVLRSNLFSIKISSQHGRDERKHCETLKKEKEKEKKRKSPSGRGRRKYKPVSVCCLEASLCPAIVEGGGSRQLPAS